MSGYKVGDFVMILGKVVEVHGADVGYSVELFSKTDQYTARIRPDLVIAKADRPAKPEADHDAIVRDVDGDLWTWDVRQQAWSCNSVTPTSKDKFARPDYAFLTWETLDSTLGPLGVYEQT